ncbi:hypothetical protein ACFO0N_07280 [Halobium salinum]|uniref:SHOCT domain-containing protein n=1 Tax=Halobium salinum TaxID=1364940 RepID=A0ABD5PAI5_9EURY|nr:hypothetical protein [Halobium salinum]
MTDSWSSRHLLSLLVVALAVVLSLLVGVVGAGALLVFGASAAVATDLFPWLVAAAFLTQSTVVLCVAVVWLVLSRAALAVGDRLYLGAVEAESEHWWAERLRLADRFAPLTRHDTDAVSRLQRRYVDGNLDEAAFERELDRLLDEGGAVDEPSTASDSGFENAGGVEGVGADRDGAPERERSVETERGS